MNKLYWANHLVLGSFGNGQLDTVAIEAMACGRPVIHSISAKHFQDTHCPLEELTSIEQIATLISTLLTKQDVCTQRTVDQLNYVDRFHHPVFYSIPRLMTIYKKLLG